MTTFPSKLAPVAALLALATASGVRADPNPYYIGVTQAFTHDSNVFRRPSNDPQGLGRELFAVFRANATGAEQGAISFAAPVHPDFIFTPGSPS